MKKNINYNYQNELKFNLKKIRTFKLINKYELNIKHKYLLFYTDVRNLLYILSFGINPIGNIKLKQNENYIVWSYSQLHDQIQLELINSSHNNFWIWASNQEIELANIAVIAINFNLLFNNCKRNWKFNNITSIISVFENIDPRIFEWVLVKNKQWKEIVEKNIKNKKYNIKVFYSLDGNIKI